MSVQFPAFQLQQQLNDARQVPNQKQGAATRPGQTADQAQGGSGASQQKKSGGTNNSDAAREQRIRQIEQMIAELQKRLDKIQMEYIQMLQKGPQAEGELRTNRMTMMLQTSKKLQEQIQKLTEQMVQMAAGGAQPPQAQGVNQALKQGVFGAPGANGASAPAAVGFTGLNLRA